MSNIGYIPKPKYTDEDLDTILSEAIFTPDSLVYAAMLSLKKLYPNFRPRTCLEPGSGEGVHCDQALMVFDSIVETTALDILMWDVSEAHDFVYTDYLSWETNHRFDFIPTNPPYSGGVLSGPSFAELFIIKSHSLLSSNGLGFFLCKYSIAGCYRRFLMWKKINLRHIFMIVPRPSFYGKSSDACEYCYFVFDRGVPSIPTFSWLDWKNLLLP